MKDEKSELTVGENDGAIGGTEMDNGEKVGEKDGEIVDKTGVNDGVNDGSSEEVSDSRNDSEGVNEGVNNREKEVRKDVNEREKDKKMSGNDNVDKSNDEKDRAWIADRVDKTGQNEWRKRDITDDSRYVLAYRNGGTQKCELGEDQC